jgi:tetratricopeptide (TPR) repeat protein
MGRALYELGDMHRAAPAMRRALAAAERSHDAEQLRSTRVSAAAVFVESGAADVALGLLDLAEADATGVALGRVRTQRSFVLQHLGRHAEALDEIDRAATAFQRGGDPLAHLRQLVNRSLVLLHVGRLDDAERSLNRAARLAQRLDQGVIAAGIVGNLAVARARGGHISAALLDFDRSRALYLANGSPGRAMAVLELDRAEALTHAGLFRLAVDASRAALRDASASGNLVAEGDAELALASALLAAGRLADASRTADAAAATLRRAARPEASLRARGLSLEAAIRAADTPTDVRRLAPRARRLARRLRAGGLAVAADALDGARWHATWRHDLLDDIADELDPLLAPPADSLRAAQRSGLHQLRRGDLRQALRTLRTANPRLSIELQHGRPRPHATADRDVTSLGRHVALALGRVIESLRWTPGPVAHCRSFAEIRALLGERTLAQYLIDRDDVWLVVISPTRHVLHRCEGVTAVTEAVGALLGWMDRSAAGVGSPAHLERGRKAAEAVGSTLHTQLVAALAGSGGVVMVSGALGDVPWGALPDLVDLSTSVAPITHRATGVVVPAVAAIAVGPDVEAGRIETAALRGSFPGATALTGRRATRSAVTTLLGRRGVVHLAAHGQVERDMPAMTSIRLHDGALTLVELGEIEVRADVVVLTSCSTAARVGPLDDRVSFADTLVQRGAGAVVAPLTPVGHRASADFAAHLHRRLAEGTAIGEALRALRVEWSTSPLAERRVAAMTFECIGRPDIRLIAPPAYG